MRPLSDSGYTALMTYANTPLPATPERGFYYHYKHDPAGEFNQYAYEVVGVAHHTEDDARPEDEFMVIYRPLYEAFVYKLGKLLDARPLSMFMEEVEKDGMRIKRFTRITDMEVIEKLNAKKKELYPELES